MKYYYDNMNLKERYATLWNGYLSYEIKLPNDNPEKILSICKLNDIVTDICKINFYINIDNSNIYISLCQDSHYYYYDFEKDIKKVILKLEKEFDINIIGGEFNANEVNHNANQYKYTILKKNEKITLKKKTLNWSSYKSKKDLSDQMKKLNIDD